MDWKKIYRSGPARSEKRGLEQSNVRRDLLFRLAAAGAVVAVSVHAAALVVPAFGAAAYPPAYPAWRHGAFIGIDSALAWLFPRRPGWFVWAYAVLTAQVLYGHGGQAWATWRHDEYIAWIDAVAIVAVPLGLVLLVIDYRKRA